MAFVNPILPSYAFVMNETSDKRKLTLLVTPEEHELFDKDCRYGYERRVSMNARLRAFIRRELGLPALDELAMPRRKAKPR